MSKNIFINDNFFSKTTVFIKFVVSFTIVNDNPSLTIVNDDPSLTIVNDDPSLTIVNIFININFFSKTIVFQKDRFFKKQSYKKRSLIVFIKTIVFKNDRYSFSKSSKRVGRFQNDRFFRKRNDRF